MRNYKTYKAQRYTFFWMAIVAYFVPYVIATIVLLPMMRASMGQKIGIGLAVVALNALPFIGGIFRKIFAHFPFVNWLAILFIALAAFFTLDLFREYVYTFCTIELCAAVGAVVACVFWALHVKYKRQSLTVKTVIKSGVLGGKE